MIEKDDSAVESSRLAELDAKLNAHEAAQRARAVGGRPQRDHSAISSAMRVASDLLGGVIIGGALAYGASLLWPDYRTLLLAGGFLLGIGMGLYNTWRAAMSAFRSPER